MYVCVCLCLCVCPRETIAVSIVVGIYNSD